MHKDPILVEVHRLREEYAASLNQDAAAIYQDVLRRQRETTRELVRFAPRPPSVPATSLTRKSKPSETA